MTIYRVWCYSMHKVTYTLGYFQSKLDAEACLMQQTRTGSGPEFGIEEIPVIPERSE